MRDFSSVAPYLQDPLVLIGFFLFLGFLFARYLLQRGIIPPLPPTQGFRILRTILLYGFVIGLTLIILGFLFKYKELQAAQQHAAAVLLEQQRAREGEEARLAQARKDRIEAEKKIEEEATREKENTVRLLKTELDANLKIVNELRKNTETFLGLFSQTAQVLRRPGIEVFQLLFPADNLASRPGTAPVEMSRAAFEAFQQRGFDAKVPEQKQFTAAGELVAAAVDRTLPTMESLRDRTRTRYVPISKIWDHNQEILRTLLVDVSPFQEAYSNLASLRSNYDIVCDRVIDYQTAVRDFLRPLDNRITPESLTKVLSTERLALSVASAYGEELVKNITRLREISRIANDAAAKPKKL